MSDKTFDVAIVGGGPAGLSAAVWLARYLHSVVLIDSGDPRNWQTRGIHGYLGFGHVTPKELRGRGREDAKRSPPVTGSAVDAGWLEGHRTPRCRRDLRCSP